MRATRFVISTILLLLSGNSLYAKSLSEAETKARDYSVQGATFGMSLADFEKKFSVERPVTIDSNNDIVQHEIVSGYQNVQFEFKRSRLSTISVVFAFDGDDRIERENEVAKQTMQLFGKPHQSSDATFQWSFPNVHRSVTCAPARGYLTVTVRDTSTQE